MAFSAKEAHRAATFQKKRQKEQEDLQLKKKKIEEELQVGSISNKFAAHYDAIEQQLKSDTIGGFAVVWWRDRKCLIDRFGVVWWQEMFNR